MRPRKIGFTEPGGMIEQAIKKGREMALLDVRDAYIEMSEKNDGGVSKKYVDAAIKFRTLIGLPCEGGIYLIAKK